MLRQLQQLMAAVDADNYRGCGGRSGLLEQCLAVIEQVPVIGQRRAAFKHGAFSEVDMLVVSDARRDIGHGFRNQGQGFVAGREFELQTGAHPNVVVPEVHVVARFTVMSIQPTQPGELLVERQQLGMQRRRFAVGDYQQGSVSVP